MSVDAPVRPTVQAPPPPRRRTRARGGRPAWQEPPTALGTGAKIAVIAVVVVLMVYPFLSVLGTSLASEPDIAEHGGLVLVPQHPTLAAYRAIFAGGVVTHALLISVGVTLIGTLCSLAATVGMAYGLSRRGVVGGRFFLLVALFTMLFNPGIIPSFLVVKQLGLLGSFGALVLPSLVSAFNLVVLRSFFMNLPRDLFDSATIDGAGDFRVLLRIVLPLSRSVLSVVGLFYAVSYWNAFFNAVLYLDSDKWPLAVVLRQYVLLGQPMAGSNTTGEGDVPSAAIQMAVVIVALVPILCVYPLLQRSFTKGVLTGAIKG